MFFKDDKESYIAINKGKEIIEFNKESKNLYVETKDTSSKLYYTYQQDLEEDYQKLKRLVKESKEIR